jgi:hypothetical protein
MADPTKAPDDLVDVGPNGYIQVHQAEPTEQTEGAPQANVMPADVISVDPDYVANQVDLFNPVTGTMAAAAAARPAIKKVIGMDEHTGRRSLETYLKSQIHHEYPGLNLNALEQEIKKIHGPRATIVTPHDVQEALKEVRGFYGASQVDLSPYTKSGAAPKTRAGKAEALVGALGENLNPLTGQGMGAKVFRTMGRGALGSASGFQGAQAWNRLQEGDVPGAIVSGTGAVGSGLMTSRNPKAKGAGAILQGLSILGQGLHDSPEEKAEGGLIHLKKGGAPEFGEARAYEPSFNEQIGDYVAPYIGRQQADALFGGPRAQTVDKLNPLGWLAQTPGSVAQGAKDFYQSAKEGDYLGGMGNYLLAAMDVSPMLSKGKRLANLLQLQGFNAGVDVGAPMIEKGAHAAAPYVGKAAKFIKKYLPTGEYEGVLAGSRLTPELYRGKGVSVEGYAAGKKVQVGKKVADILSEAEQGATAPSGYLHHTAINPNPFVGTRFETKDLGGLAPVKPMNLEDIRGHMIHTKPWDLSSRNQQILSVSGKPLTEDIVSHGGQGYVRDLEHRKRRIGGASAFPVSNQIQNISNIASHEGEKLGGTGQVTMTPSTMARFSEDYAVPTFDTYRDLWKQAEPGAERTEALLQKLRFADPKTLKSETPIPFAGMVKDVKYPFRDLKSLDFNDPEVMDRFLNVPDLRKAAIREWRSKENQKMMGYNAEDLSAAHTDPDLVGVPPGYAGHTMIEMHPGSKPQLSSNITYDTDYSGDYLGSIGHTPAAVLLNKSYSNILEQMRKLHPQANEDKLHRLTMGALYTRNEGVSDLVNDEMINRVGAYHEAVKQNKVDPNDIKGALEFLSKPGAYKEGGEV